VAGKWRFVVFLESIMLVCNRNNKSRVNFSVFLIKQHASIVEIIIQFNSFMRVFANSKEHVTGEY
jgi:hypothetical protein